MHPCLEYWVTIGREVVFLPGLPTHLVQELNVGTVWLPGIDNETRQISIISIGAYTNIDTLYTF